VNNLTTIEYKEKMKGEEKNNFFNVGFSKNIVDVLGENVLLWFLPISKKLFKCRHYR
jgi:hypothetical protein